MPKSSGPRPGGLKDLRAEVYGFWSPQSYAKQGQPPKTPPKLVQKEAQARMPEGTEGDPASVFLELQSNLPTSTIGGLAGNSDLTHVATPQFSGVSQTNLGSNYSPMVPL